MFARDMKKIVAIGDVSGYANSFRNSFRGCVRRPPGLLFNHVNAQIGPRGSPLQHMPVSWTLTEEGGVFVVPIPTCSTRGECFALGFGLSDCRDEHGCLDFTAEAGLKRAAASLTNTFYFPYGVEHQACRYVCPFTWGRSHCFVILLVPTVHPFGTSSRDSSRRMRQTSFFTLCRCTAKAGLAPLLSTTSSSWPSRIGN